MCAHHVSYRLGFLLLWATNEFINATSGGVGGASNGWWSWSVEEVFARAESI